MNRQTTTASLWDAIVAMDRPLIPVVVMMSPDNDYVTIPIEAVERSAIEHLRMRTTEMIAIAVLLDNGRFG